MKANKSEVPKPHRDLAWDDATAAIDLKFAAVAKALYAQTVDLNEENIGCTLALKKPGRKLKSCACALMRMVNPRITIFQVTGFRPSELLRRRSMLPNVLHVSSKF